MKVPSYAPLWWPVALVAICSAWIASGWHMTRQVFVGSDQYNYTDQYETHRSPLFWWLVVFLAIGLIWFCKHGQVIWRKRVAGEDAEARALGSRTWWSEHTAESAAAMTKLRSTLPLTAEGFPFSFPLGGAQAMGQVALGSVGIGSGGGAFAIPIAAAYAAKLAAQGAIAAYKSASPSHRRAKELAQVEYEEGMARLHLEQVAAYPIAVAGVERIAGLHAQEVVRRRLRMSPTARRAERIRVAALRYKHQENERARSDLRAARPRLAPNSESV